MQKKSHFFLSLALACFSLIKVQACQLPVFRYALERWPSDPFRITLFRRGELTEDQKHTLEAMPFKGYKAPPYLNTIVRQVDLGGTPDPKSQQLWKSQENPELPWIVVEFPRSDRIAIPAWTGKLDLDNARLLADSPARREVARRILKGDSAVWVLVESGDAKTAQATSEMVTRELKRLETTLKLPVQDNTPASAPTSKIPLKIAFSVLRIRADDPAEKALVQMLRKSLRREMPANASVIAYPIYGRGRCLGGYAGNDLTPEALERECSFLVGPCTCQAKEMNPGVDLLMAVNWVDILAGNLTVEQELPPLTGLMPVAVVTNGTNPSAEQRVQAPAVQKKTNLMRNVVAALGGGGILVIACTLLFLRRKSE